MMCKYLDQKYYHMKCKKPGQHMYTHRNWKECDKAKRQGHFCPNAIPETDGTGNPIRLGSTRRPGDCPMCPPPLPQVCSDLLYQDARQRRLNKLAGLSHHITGITVMSVRRVMGRASLSLFEGNAPTIRTFSLKS